MQTMLTNAGRWLADITDYYWCFTDAGRCLPDGDQYLPNGSQGNKCCQPSISCKNWWKNQQNGTNMSWHPYFWLKQQMYYPISWLTLVISATIGSIGYYRLSISKHRWHRWGTQCIFGHLQLSQHWRPNVIGTRSQFSNQIVSSLAAIGHRMFQIYI